MMPERSSIVPTTGSKRSRMVAPVLSICLGSASLPPVALGEPFPMLHQWNEISSSGFGCLLCTLPDRILRARCFSWVAVSVSAGFPWQAPCYPKTSPLDRPPNFAHVCELRVEVAPPPYFPNAWKVQTPPETALLEQKTAPNPTQCGIKSPYIRSLSPERQALPGRKAVKPGRFRGFLTQFRHSGAIWGLNQWDG